MTEVISTFFYYTGASIWCLLAAAVCVAIIRAIVNSKYELLRELGLIDIQWYTLDEETIISWRWRWSKTWHRVEE